MADIEERMKTLLADGGANDNAGDTFAERAEWYYQKRPHLLALLQDLYNAYITLLDKNRHHCCPHDHDQQEDCWSVSSHVDSEAQSTLSYQHPPATVASGRSLDELIADLVAGKVENDVLLNQLSYTDQLQNESSRKIELLKKLLELLEAERVMLVNENVRLGYKVTALLEENKAVAAESMFMKRKAAELAKCMLRMRDDYRVCVLNKRIEDLQEQIFSLEERNKEYCRQTVKGDQQEWRQQKTTNGVGEVTLVGCLQLDTLKLKTRNAANSGVEHRGGKVSRWWERVKNMDAFTCSFYSMCGFHAHST